MDRAKLRGWVCWFLCSACIAAGSKQSAFKTVLNALRAGDKKAGLNIVDIWPKTSPSFPFVTCHSCPCDVCNHIASVGLFAPVATSITSRYILTQEACVGRDGIVLDVGANIGYFTMLAAAAGCKVHAFEPDPAPRSLLHLNVMINEVHSLVKVHDEAISAVKTTGVMAGQGQWGHGGEQAAIAATSGTTFEMKPMTDFVHRDVLLLKVDTEGYELEVFEGAWGLLEKHQVKNVIAKIKEFNSQAKRKLIHRIMVTGQFKHVYNYAEASSRSIDEFEGIRLFAMIFNITDIVKENLELPFYHEDFWFRMEPMGPGQFTPYAPHNNTT